MLETKRPKLLNEENNERQHFDFKAKVYDKQYGYDDPFTQYKINKKSLDFVKFVKEYFPDGKVNVLEVGCGTGEYTKIISGYLPNANITAIDISKECVEIAKKKCQKRKNVKFAVKSVYKTEYKNNSFDVVFGYYILHHLDIRKVSNEIFKLLRKGGIGFFYEPNILNPYVYLVKKNLWLKNKVGDSPDEWAINPLNIGNEFNKFHVEAVLSEYVLPLSFINLKIMKMMDSILNLSSFIPFFKYLGGSVQIKIFKN